MLAPNLEAVVADALANAVIRDDEGEFPRLYDLLDFSGENKARTVARGLARAAIAAISDDSADKVETLGEALFAFSAILQANGMLDAEPVHERYETVVAAFRALTSETVAPC